MKKFREKLGSVTIPGWLFVILTVVFDELLLHFWITDELQAARLVTITAFSLAFGTVLALLVSLLPKPGARKWTAVAVSTAVTVLYMVEYFISDAYQTFMPISMILDGAGGVASDFISDVMILLVSDFWRIILVLLPIVNYALFAKDGKMGWKLRTALAAGAVVLYTLSFVSANFLTKDAARFDSAYNFDSAIRALGLNVSLGLNLVHGSEDAEEELTFIAPTLPPETTPPPVTEPAAGETAPPTEPPVVYGENVLDLDFAALAEAESSRAISSIHSYVAAQTPSSQNEYTGLFKGKNLILITAEAFALEVIDPELTPTLYRLANEGIKFTDYYQPIWGGSTSTGEFSIMTGLVAAGGLDSMKEGIQQDMFLTMGKQLQKLGYHSAAYHNHYHTFYDRHKTHEKLGYDTFTGMGNGLEEGVKEQWPQSDLEMMEFTIPQYIDKQPFSIYYMTVSGHCRYTQEGNAMCRKNYDVVKDLDCSERIKCYIAANLELEYALQTLVEALEEAGIAEDTVIVMGTDHYPYGLEKSSTWNNKEDYLAELYGYPATNHAERDHSALIIWSGCLEDKDIVIDTPVYSLDILPTLSNLFGVEYDSRLLVGRDIFSDAQPLVLWYDFNWKTDKGFYNASTGVFTPAEGAQVEEGYVDYIAAIVRDKITYSRSVQKNDYFNYVTAALKQKEE